MMNGEYMIQLENIVKNYGNVEAVKDIHLNIEKGEMVTLLGASGCGKTTTLKCITGQHYPDKGTIRINGQDVTYLPTYQRNIGMVFQNFTLFPHKTVYENVEFPLKVRKMNKTERKQKVLDILKSVHLEKHAKKYPRQLSGGQQQRVSLARALVYRPKVILFDEPLSNLDAKLREKMRQEIKDIQTSMHITAVYVTHDQQEALAISDKVAIMNNGVIEQYGTPEEIYDRPRTRYVAEFIGLSNFLKGKIVKKIDRNRVLFKSGELLLESEWSGEDMLDGEKEVLIRPSDILLLPHNKLSDSNEIEGCIQAKTYLGDRIEYKVSILDSKDIRVVAKENYALNQKVIVQINKGKSWLINH